jgi:hypothetical protein
MLVARGGPTMMARIGVMKALNRSHVRVGPQKAQEGRMTVWVYVNTSKQVGDKDHLNVIANEIAAEEWFSENDPEGVAFEYPVSDRQ